MLGIGHRLQKETKKKILLQKAKEFNEKYDQLAAEGKQSQATQIINQQNYQKRHEIQPNMQPYKTSQKMNPLGGAIHQGYDMTEKTLTQTQTLYKPMEEHMNKTKKGIKIDPKKAEQQHADFLRMKKCIDKDHIAEDRQIDLEQPKQTQHRVNFKNDQKLKEQVLIKHNDKKHNLKMNDLKDYAQNYLKSKSSLRKC